MPLFSRARASLILKDAPLYPSPVRPFCWVEFRGGDHYFEDASGKLFAVDLVLGEAKAVPFKSVAPSCRVLHA